MEQNPSVLQFNMVRERIDITFAEFRRIVIALHTCGTRLKSESGTTASHASVGQEYLELANRIDRMTQSPAEQLNIIVEKPLRS